MKEKLYPLGKLSSIDEEDIIFIEYFHDLEVTLLNAKEMVADRLNFTNDKKHYVVIEATHVKSVASDAKNYLLNPEYGTKNILAAAIIANTPVSAMLANIFIKSSKNFPSKFFSKKTDAFKWIKELKNK